MDALITILGILLGLFLACIDIAHKQRSTLNITNKPYNTPPQPPRKPQFLPSTQTRHGYDDLTLDMRRRITSESTTRSQISGPPSYIPLYPQARNEPLNTNQILENWRKSIIGLIKLAENNLQIAECYITTMNYKGAVDAAVASVENISRALLHCYGEKPDPKADQEEPLRIVARRFQGEERAQFEKAIDDAVKIYRNKICETYLLGNGIQFSLLNEAKTRQIVEIAKKVVVQFRRIMEEHFGTEIAELSEKCPKCEALSISLWAFNILEATYQCNICSHKWTQPRNT